MVTDELKQIAALYAQGNLQGARVQGETALAMYPSSAPLLQFLGVIYCQSGDVAKGAKLLRQALDASPGNVDVRINLAKALVDLGNLDEAGKLCSGQSDINLLRMQAEILKAQGRAGESAQIYRRIVAAQGQDFQAWNNLGNTYLEVKDVANAVKALEKARKLRPNEPQIRLNLGRALAAASQFKESLAEFQEAARLSPNEAIYLLEFGRALQLVERTADALAVLGSAARLDPHNAEIYAAIGLCFVNLQEVDRAEEAYRVALQVDPTVPTTYLNFGRLLEQSNRVEEVGALLEQAGAAGVKGDEIDFIRALLLNREGKHREALDLACAIGSEHIDANARARLIVQFADRLGEADVAFSAAKEMNQATANSHAGLAYDGTEHRRYVEELAQFTTPEWYAHWQAVDVPSQPPAPVFLVGFPRSGTTLLETILMGHPDTHLLEELPITTPVSDAVGDLSRIAELGKAEVAALRQRYFEELAKLSPPPPGKMVIDKLPLNMLRGPLLHRIFPDARFIFALRHPCDVVLSCFMQNFKVNQAMASFLDIHNAALFYDRALSYWHQSWSVLGLNVHTLRYEAMVVNAEAELKPLVAFLGLEWNDRLLDHQSTAIERGQIRTPSYSQVAEKLYLRSSGRWERYREQMKDVLPILAPWVERLGYDPLELDQA
jgi:Flp pilus assembly protein TadD